MNCITWFTTKVNYISNNFSSRYTLCELELVIVMINNYSHLLKFLQINIA